MDKLDMSDAQKNRTGNERIIILTRTGRNLLKTGCLFLLFLFAAAMLIFYWPLLAENPFAVDLHWEMPKLACRNIHKNTVVVDRLGKRVVILDPEGNVRSEIHPNPFSRKAISFVMHAAMDDKYVYILDLQHSSNGAQINGEKVLVYDLNGKYVKTLYEVSHPEVTQRDSVLCDVSCCNGKVFVSRRDKEKITVFQILDQKLDVIHVLPLPGKDVFTCSYMPDTKSLFAVTRDSCYYLNYLNNLEEVPVPDRGTHWNSMCIAPSGERYYLDSYRHEIIQFRPNVKKKDFLQLQSRDEIRKITDSYGLGITLQDDVLSWCCVGENKVVSFNVTTGEKKVSVKAAYPLKFLLFRGFIWGCTILLLIFFCISIARFFVKIVKSIRKKHDVEEGLAAKYANAVHTIWGLYGKNAFAMTCAFLAVTAVITFSYAERTWQIMESSVKSTASSLSGLPGCAFGDFLGELRSSKDYNTKAFRILQKVGNSICFSEEGMEFDLGFSLFRRLPDGRFMYVIDTFDRYCMGKIISKDDPDLRLLYSKLLNVKDRKIHIVDSTRYAGRSIYFTFAPIFDSDGRETGVAAISCSREKVYTETKGMLFKLSVDLLLLFIIFVMVSGEITLVWEFRKLRKLNPCTGKLMQTVCEGHRSCQFLTVMSLYLDAAFLPTLAIELMRHSGLSGNEGMLAAVPLSLRSLMLVAALALGGFLAKYNPGRFLKSSALLSILCYGFLIHAVLSERYLLLLIGVAVQGILHGMKFASLDAVSGSGLQPNPQFKNLVYVNTEYLIGAAIGTSIGSLWCANFGYGSVFGIGILLELLLFIVGGLFIADDINLQKRHSLIQNPRTTLLSDWSKIRRCMKHVLRPDLLALLFCVMIPMNVLGQFDSYVLPVYNAWSGYVQLLTGFTGTVTKVLALILIPWVFNQLGERGNRLPIAAGMFFMIAGLVFFALDSSLLVMGILLLIITVFNVVFITTAERLRLAMAAQDKVKYSDVVGFFHAFQYVGAAAAPLLMGWCLKYGFSLFGYIFAAVLSVMLVLFLLFSAHFRRSVIGKAM